MATVAQSSTQSGQADAAPPTDLDRAADRSCPKLKRLGAQVAKHEIPGLARDMVNAYAGFLRDHYNELGADGDLLNDFVEFTQGIITRCFGNWGTRTLYRTWIVAAGSEGSGAAIGNSSALAMSANSSAGRGGRLGSPPLPSTGPLICGLFQVGGPWWNLLGGWHRDPPREVAQGLLLPVPVSDFAAATQFVLDHGTDLEPEDLAELVNANARALYGAESPNSSLSSSSSGAANGGSGASSSSLLTCALRGGAAQLHQVAQGEDGADVACVRFDLLEYYLVHMLLHARRTDRTGSQPSGSHRRPVPLANLQQYDDAGLDVAGPWAVFTAHDSMMSTFQGLSEFMDDHSGSVSGGSSSSGGGGGPGMGGGGGSSMGGVPLNGRIDRLVQRSPYLALVLKTASSLWPHRGNHWGKAGSTSSDSGGSGTSSSLSSPDERCGELFARLVCDLWLTPDHLPNHDGAEATGRAERRKARLEFNQQQAAAAQQSNMLGGGGGLASRGMIAMATTTSSSIGQSGSSKSNIAYLPPPAPASKHLPVAAAQGVLVCSAQLLADPDLHSACIRRPMSDLFPTCAAGSGGGGARIMLQQGGLANAVPLPPPSLELQRFMEQGISSGSGGGVSLSPLKLELEVQRRDANGDPARAEQARALLHELRQHRMPGLNPGTFAPWQPAAAASRRSSSSLPSSSSALGSPGFLNRSSTSTNQGASRPHPVGILHSQAAGYLASGFKQVSPRTQPEAFVLLVETWLLWMQPWTAPSQLKASAAAAANAPSTRGGAAPLPGSSSSSTGASRYANHHAAAYGPEWENWVLACEDVYTVPLLPFLQRMGSLDYGGSNKRDAQLKACESVMEVFKGPLLDVLRQSPTEALRRALEVAGSVQAPGDRYTGCSLAPLGQGAQRPEVGRFLKDLHHSLVFGNWLSPTLDYDDHLNYLWWAAALAAVQVAQLLELITTGTAARWRLNRLVADLSDVCGLTDPDLLRRAMLGQKPSSGPGGSASGGGALVGGSSVGGSGRDGSVLGAVEGWVTDTKERLQRARRVVTVHGVKLGASVVVVTSIVFALRGQSSSTSTSTSSSRVGSSRSRTAAAAASASNGSMVGDISSNFVYALALHLALVVAYVVGAHLLLLGKRKQQQRDATRGSGLRYHPRTGLARVIGPYDAPLCSYELWPLFCLARALSRAGAALHKSSSSGSSSNGRYAVAGADGDDEVDLRWIADYRNWTFGALIGAAVAHSTVRAVLFSWAGLFAGGLFALFQRYPHLWFKISSGRWFSSDSSGDYD